MEVAELAQLTPIAWHRLEAISHGAKAVSRVAEDTRVAVLVPTPGWFDC